MRVKLTKDCTVYGVEHKAGAVLVLSTDTGRDIVYAGAGTDEDGIYKLKSGSARTAKAAGQTEFKSALALEDGHPRRVAAEQRLAILNAAIEEVFGPAGMPGDLRQVTPDQARRLAAAARQAQQVRPSGVVGPGAPGARVSPQQAAQAGARVLQRAGQRQGNPGAQGNPAPATQRPQPPAKGG